jgi:hypothetical protein
MGLGLFSVDLVGRAGVEPTTNGLQHPTEDVLQYRFIYTNQ